MHKILYLVTDGQFDLQKIGNKAANLGRSIAIYQSMASNVGNI